jgi:phosphoserine aminotransferase
MLSLIPGPSELYFTVHDHLRKAIRNSVGSLSHRSQEFETIFRRVTEGLKELLSIPAGYHIFFTGSATEIFERSIQNLVEHESFHLVNGAFSARFYEVARQLGKRPTRMEATPGTGFREVEIPAQTDFIAVTHNETSTGVSLPPGFIEGLRKKNENALVVVDAVSSLPYPSFDYHGVDSVFFSVQKGFGLPAGLGVWLVNDRCLARAEHLLALGISIGSYHNLPTLYSHAVKNQTPETPNVLALYLLAGVVEDMLEKGIERIRRETEYKAAILYHLLDQHPVLKPFVAETEYRSKTVITLDCGKHLAEVKETLLHRGFLPGDGYGEFRKNQLRLANFPTHSKEQFEALTDALNALKF